MFDNRERMIAELEGAIELARQMPADLDYNNLTEARMSVIGQRLNRATGYYNALGEELDERVNALNPPVASVDADAWRDGDAKCPSCGADEAPEIDTLYGGRSTLLRCGNCGHRQEGS